MVYHVSRTIDSMLYTWFIHAIDNTSKNILWVTYDGIHWMPSVYDLDGTWGLYYNGEVSVESERFIATYGNVLWEKLWSNMHQQIVDRWIELRNGPLSLQNIDRQFVDFYKKIPNVVYAAEAKMWSLEPSIVSNHIQQIIKWALAALTSMDNELGVTSIVDSYFAVSLICDEHCSVEVYISTDYSLKSNMVELCFARESETGYISTSGGQVNIKVLVEEGYLVDSIDVSGAYKNLKNIEDNIYRVTKISSNLIITIATKES